jgi:hypothetical protein
MKKIAIYLPLIMLFSNIVYSKDSPSTQETIPDIKNTEHYCDPTANADVLANIKNTQDKINSMDMNNPNKISLLMKLDNLNGKLKCINRPIPSQ